MALKTSEKTAEVSVESTAGVIPNTTVLELALYKIYTWGPNTYEQGKPYRFKSADAMALLAEQDTGRQVWKLYKPSRPKQAPKNDVVDATMIQVPTQVEDTGMLVGSGKRIDIGDDSEIADVLNRDGDVTV